MQSKSPPGYAAVKGNKINSQLQHKVAFSMKQGVTTVQMLQHVLTCISASKEESMPYFWVARNLPTACAAGR